MSRHVEEQYGGGPTVLEPLLTIEDAQGLLGGVNRRTVLRELDAGELVRVRVRHRQGGLRIGEAVALRWGDVDVAGGRLRLPRSVTKTNTSRWVQLPSWLMEAISEQPQRATIAGGALLTSRLRDPRFTCAPSTERD